MKHEQSDVEQRLVRKLFDTAEEKLKQNLKEFSGRTVLIEGGGYEKIWLETQPMGGEMYAKRDMVPALNNQLLFMECQRADSQDSGQYGGDRRKDHAAVQQVSGILFSGTGAEHVLSDGKRCRLSGAAPPDTSAV